MKTKHFIKQFDHDRLEQAIHQAEQGNAADIVLYISHHRVTEAYAAAEKVFHDLGLSKSVDQLSLLFFLAPETRKFAVIGSKLLHEKVGERYWQELVELLGSHFKTGRYTDGLIAALTSAGLQLRTHFPSTTSGPRGLDIVEE